MHVIRQTSSTPWATMLGHKLCFALVCVCVCPRLLQPSLSMPPPRCTMAASDGHPTLRAAGREVGRWPGTPASRRIPCDQRRATTRPCDTLGLVDGKDPDITAPCAQRVVCHAGQNTSAHRARDIRALLRRANAEKHSLTSHQRDPDDQAQQHTMQELRKGVGCRTPFRPPRR